MRFGVTGRFVLVLVVLVPSLVGIAWHGADDLSSTRRVNDTLFNDIIATENASAGMIAAMDDVHTTGLSAIALLPTDPARSRRLTTHLQNVLIPAADADLIAVRRLHAADEAAEKRTITRLETRWFTVRALWHELALDPPAAPVAITRFDAAFEHLNLIARALIAREVRDGRAEFIDSAHPYANKREQLLLLLGLSVVASLMSLGWLYRGVLPRARRYSKFAAAVAQGDFDGHLDSPGRDDLAQLGRSLEGMANRRKEVQEYDVSQLQFSENMQLSEDEAEAHRMLNLERTVRSSDVVIINRNNSQDRLESVTELLPDSPLVTSLEGAAPRSCIAVRQARTHERGDGEETLLQCAVCEGCPGQTTCTPFLVGGEVIGSVLVNSALPLADQEARRIRDSVVQAAPVLANLRNLGIAETRAATDSLTGLPNRRSIDANVMRMVAHAGRSMEPTALLLLDLDHFKQVNDRYGHTVGDEVLAAVGATLRAKIRDSDFAGRYGGEEFVVVLPNNALEGAVIVAEQLRRAISTIVIPSVDQAITVSIGVAIVPDHAGSASTLIRAADRALYLAKNNGRDRVETARVSDLDEESSPHPGRLSGSNR
jgi:diguanylate cyclase (GGDEF)-like protein